MLERVDPSEKFDGLDEFWVPKIVGELNGQYVKIVKFKDEYVWHHHANEDELFFVLDGEIDIHLRDGIVHLNQGEFLIVPRGVEHKPVARAVARVLLFEPDTTRNTGNVDHEYTIEPKALEKI